MHNIQNSLFNKFVLWLDKLSIGSVLFIASILRLSSIPIIRSYLHPQTWEFGPLAENIVKGVGYSDVLNNGTYLPSIYMPPVYPYFLALFFWLGGEKPVTFFVIETVQALLGVLLVYVVYRLALLLQGPRCAIAAACMTTLYPTQIYMCNEFHGISIYIVLGTAAVFFLVRYLRETHSLMDIIAAGVCSGGVLLFRFEAPGLTLFYAVVLIVQGGKKVIAPTFLFLIVAFGCLAPWTIRNYREIGKFIPLCASGGVNLWIGNNPWATGSDRYLEADAVRGQFSYNPQPVGSADYGDFDSITDVKRAFEEVPDGRSSLAMKDAALRKLAITYMTSNPGRVVKLAMKKMFIFWVYDPKHEKGRNPAYWVPSILLTILAVWGAVLRGKKLFTDDLLMVVAIVCAVGVGVVAFVLPRYKIVADPFFIIVAANIFAFNSIKSEDANEVFKT